MRSLAVSPGSGLSSRFSPLVAEHTIAVNADRNTLELRPSAFDADATLSVWRGTQELADIESGDSATIAIEQAQTTVTFTVRSVNRQSRDYRLVIHRLNDVVDVDADSDGLIEISKLENLNAVRYHPDGSGYRATTGSLKLTIGCPQSGCNGYELIDDLDFADAMSYRDAANRALYYAGTDGWQPLRFWGVRFDGNRHTIANLKVQTVRRGGLFAYLGVGSRLSRVGLLDVDIRGGSRTGALVGFASHDSRIEHCHASGRVTTNNNASNVYGGLVGLSFRGLVSHSRSSVAVTGNSTVGGLAGEADFITDSHTSGDVVGNGNVVGGLVGSIHGSISNSHASGTVTGDINVDGLAGFVFDTTGFAFTISNSYASGAVRGRRSVGGLVGTSRGSFDSENLANHSLPASITNSYWNVQTSGAISSTGVLQAPEFPDQEGTSLSTVQMQSPLVPGTTSTEAYYNWSVDDWDFGSSTQYPAVRRSGSSALVARQRASLASLTVQAGERLWHLDTELMQHDIGEVEGEIEQITVSATTATPAMVTVDGEPLSNGKRDVDLTTNDVTKSAEIALVEGSTSTLTVIVKSTRTDEAPPQMYTIAVWRALSDDATLRELHVSDSVLIPNFKSETSIYTAMVVSASTAVTVLATASNEHATIEVNGRRVASGERSDAIAIAADATTTLRIVVTVRDGITQEIYTVAVSHSFPFIRIRSRLFLEAPLR